MRVRAGRIQYVVVKLRAEFVHRRGRKRVQVVQQYRVIPERLNVPARLAHQRAHTFIGVVDIRRVVAEAQRIRVAEAMVNAEQTFVVVGLKWKDATVLPKHLLHRRRRGKRAPQLRRRRRWKALQNRLLLPCRSENRKVRQHRYRPILPPSQPFVAQEIKRPVLGDRSANRPPELLPVRIRFYPSQHRALQIHRERIGGVQRLMPEEGERRAVQLI